jgi:HUS1 checkpoint protein
MRFKAKIVDLTLFVNLIKAIEKIGEENCLMLLTPKKIQFIIRTEEITDGFQVWAACNVASIFDDYVIESQNGNEISFKINLEYLLKGLQSGTGAQEVFMKLTKKGGTAYLSFAIITNVARSVSITQEIPVLIQTPVQLQEYTEPVLPDPEVYIMMPPLKSLKNVVERMKNIDNYLILQANMAGELTLKVQTDNISVATFYRKLEHPHIEGKETPVTSSEQKAKVKVDVKKFSKFLFSHVIVPKNVICCIVEDTALVLHVLLDDLFITYYIPVLSQ